MNAMSMVELVLDFHNGCNEHMSATYTWIVDCKFVICFISFGHLFNLLENQNTGNYEVVPRIIKYSCLELFDNISIFTGFNFHLYKVVYVFLFTSFVILHVLDFVYMNISISTCPIFYAFSMDFVFLL